MKDTFKKQHLTVTLKYIYWMWSPRHTIVLYCLTVQCNVIHLGHRKQTHTFADYVQIAVWAERYAAEMTD